MTIDKLFFSFIKKKKDKTKNKKRNKRIFLRKIYNHIILSFIYFFIVFLFLPETCSKNRHFICSRRYPPKSGFGQFFRFYCAGIINKEQERNNKERWFSVAIRRKIPSFTDNLEDLDTVCFSLVTDVYVCFIFGHLFIWSFELLATYFGKFSFETIEYRSVKKDICVLLF